MCDKRRERAASTLAAEETRKLPPVAGYQSSMLAARGAFLFPISADDEPLPELVDDRYKELDR